MVQLISLTTDDLKNVVISAIAEYNARQIPQPAQVNPLDEDYIKIAEVCKLLRVSKVTIHQWKKEGKLPFYRIARKVFFKRSEVMDALQKISKRSV